MYAIRSYYVFQIIYHIHSYLELVRQGEVAMGEKVYLNVPSGNFGNALGGYYAMKMGLPVRKIIISSNENDVLTQLISYGTYDIRARELITTTSPAMDVITSYSIHYTKLYECENGYNVGDLILDTPAESVDHYTCDQTTPTPISALIHAATT